MTVQKYTVRNAKPEEFKKTGKLLVQVYSRLEGFPTPAEMPDYYNMLANVGLLTQNPGTELLVAVTPSGDVAGAVVYISDMKYYGSGGTATQEKNASGFRLLGVAPSTRGHGVGRLLIDACMRKAREAKQQQVIIHTTKAMQTAWKIYEKMGFRRSPDLDFQHDSLEVFGFRFIL
jgi:ribosomal protein S18 acetylase RimI-like enzyme